jgi:hypothetical protein
MGKEEIGVGSQKRELFYLLSSVSYFLRMTEIYVAIRNQDGVAMPSVNGELIIVLVTREGAFLDQQTASLRGGMAMFFGLPTGNYTVIARHSNLNPTEARQDVEISQDAIVGIRFTYNEPECQLLSIETEISYLP